MKSRYTGPTVHARFWRGLFVKRLVALVVILMIGVLLQSAVSFVKAPRPDQLNSQNLTGDLYSALPLNFEANQGQQIEQVKFQALGSGYSLFFTPGEAVISLRGAASNTTYPENSLNAKLKRALYPPAPPTSTPVDTLRMKWLGANPQPKISGEAVLQSKSNYFIGNNAQKWQLGIANYSQIHYSSVYPGVDLIYYGSQRQLEYDFVVAPGADPGQIKLSFEGANSSSVNDKGELELHTPNQKLVQHAPRIYQEVNGLSRPVGGRYLLQKDRAGHEGLTVGFEIENYDKNLPLVIDPVLVYAMRSVGTITADKAGNVYLTGGTASSTFPLQNPLQPVNNGAKDAFIAKLNASGTGLVYSTYLGGSGDDEGLAITVDKFGSAFIAGRTASSDFPTASPYQPNIGPGNADIFMVKLNPQGNNLLYSTFLGSKNLSIQGIAIDPSGAAAITGYAVGSSIVPIKNPYQPGYGGGVFDAFVTKLYPAGNDLVFSTYLGGSGDDSAQAIAADQNGNIYLTGVTTGNFPTQNPYQSYNPTYEAFVSKMSADGANLVFSTYFGGSFTIGYTIAVDLTGNVYVSGTTDGATPVKNALQPLPANTDGSDDLFLTKFTPAGNDLVFSTFLGGSLWEDKPRLTLDSNGDIYLVATSSSLNFPLKDPFQDQNKGGYDIVVTKINSAGTALIYSSYLGGSADETSPLVAVDDIGQAYISGITQSSDFPSANGSAILAGVSDGHFLAKVTDITNYNPLPVIGSISPTTVTYNGPAFNLTVTGSNFVASSVVRWNGLNRPTTFVSSTQLTASIPPNDITSPGSAAISVFSPGGGNSEELTLIIYGPLTVTKTNDDGNVGTLRYAVRKASGGATINFALSLPATVFLNDTLVIPKLPGGLTVLGGCVAGQPQITLDGSQAPAGRNGLVLSDGIKLNGLRVTRFRGIQIMPLTSNYQLDCTYPLIL